MIEDSAVPADGPDDGPQRSILTHAQAAIEALQHALQLRPPDVGSEVDVAERETAVLRDSLTGLLHKATSPDATDYWRSVLDRTNMALSLLVGLEYPSSGARRESMEQALKLLVDIRDQFAPPIRAQLFRPRSNTVAKISIVSGALLIGLLVFLWGVYYRSAYATGEKVTVDQPVPFSHKHHAGELGIDCRMCHTTVEQGPDAGMPPTQTCMTCHSQIWRDSPVLEPVRASFRSGIPIQWNRVYTLPGYVYFNHSIHIAKGIGCVSCHGHIEDMPLTAKAQAITMQWCLNCHRAPERYIRPQEEVFNMKWVVNDQLTLGRKLVQDYHVAAGQRLTNCAICHR